MLYMKCSWLGRAVSFEACCPWAQLNVQITTVVFYLHAVPAYRASSAYQDSAFPTCSTSLSVNKLLHIMGGGGGGGGTHKLFLYS